MAKLTWDDFPDAPPIGGRAVAPKPATVAGDPWAAFPDATSSAVATAPLQTYPQDAAGAYHAEDPATGPYQPVNLDGGRQPIWVNDRTLAQRQGKPQEEWEKLSPNTGKWYTQTPEGMQEYRAAEEEANKQAYNAGLDPYLKSSSTGRVLGAMSNELDSFAGALGRPLLPSEWSDEIVRNRNRQSADLQSRASGETERHLQGMAGSAGQMIGALPAVIATGGGAMALGAVAPGLTQMNESITQGRDAGLSGMKLAAYSTAMGASEAVPGAIFAKLGLPGAAGAVDDIIKPMLLGTAGAAAKKVAQHVLWNLTKSGLQEVPSELLTTFLQRTTNDLAGIENGDAQREYLDTAIQSFGFGAIANSPRVASANIQAWMERNPQVAEQIAALPETPSRSQMEAVGLTAPSTAAERTEFAKKAKEQLAAVEPVEESEMQRRAMSMTEDEFVKSAPKPSRDDPGMTFERLASGLPKEETGEYAEGPGGISRAVTRLVKGNPGVGLPFSREQAAKEQSDKVVFYDDKGDPAGVLSIQLNDKGEPDLLSVAVKPEFQGKGIATKLFDEARKRYPNVDAASGNGGYTEEGARFAYRRFRKQAQGLPEASVKDWGSGKTVSREAQDALGKYVSDNFYSDPKRASIRDDDTTYQELKAAADAEKRSNSAIEAQDSRIGGMVDRQQAKREIAAGEVNRDNIKYAELHEVEPELRTRIQQEAQRLLAETTSEDTRKALEKIIQDAGSDVGAKVESEKERIVKVLTGELDQRTINEKEHQPPRPPDPVVQGLLMPLEERKARLKQAVRNFTNDVKDDWSDYAQQLAYQKLNADQGFDFDTPPVQPTPEQVVAEFMAMADVLGVSENTENASAQQPAAEPVSAGQPETEVSQIDFTAIENPTAQQEIASPFSKPVEAGIRARYKETSGQDFGTFVEPTPEQRDAAETVLGARGTKYQFVSHPNAEAGHSFYDPATNTVFINSARKGDALWYTLAHEYMHASGADARLADIPAPLLRSLKVEYAKGASPKYLEKLKKNPDMWAQEAVARYMGKIAQDPEARAKFRTENPSVWKKFVEFVQKAMGKFTSAELQARFPEIDRFLAEFNRGVVATKPVTKLASGSPPSGRDNTTIPQGEYPPGNDRYSVYTGFANPHRGTVAGEAIEAFREGQGERKPGTFSVQATADNAIKDYEANPEAAQAKADELLQREGGFASPDEVAQIEYATNKVAEDAVKSGDFSKLIERELQIEQKRSTWGEIGLAMRENLFNTPLGRLRLIARESSTITAKEAKALEVAKAELRRLGGQSPMLEDVAVAEPPIQKKIAKVVASRTDQEKQSLKEAGRGSPAKVALAAQRVKKLQDKFAKRDAVFKARMERKGVIPTTPEALAKIVEDENASRRMVHELMAYKNLMRGGFGTNSPIGVLGAADAAFEFSQSMVLAPVNSFIRDFVGTPMNYLANRIVGDLPSALQNLAVRTVTGGKKGLEGPQIEEFGDTLKLFFTSPRVWKEALSNASNSFVQEDSILDRISGKTGNTLEIEHGAYSIPGMIGRVVRAPGYGTRRFGDDFTRTIVSHLAAMARARRMAIEEGKSGQEARDYVNEQYESRDSYAWKGDMDASGKQTGGAYDVANEMAFQEQGGEARKGFVKAGLKIRRVVPGLRWEFRFFKTLVNLSVQATKMTPFGAIGVMAKVAQNHMAGQPLAKGIKPDVYKAAVGMMMMYAMSGMFEDDEREGDFGVTGSNHPTNPNSLRFGDKFIDYTGFWPIGPALSSVADASLAYKKTGSKAEAGTALAAGVFEGMSATTIGRTLRDINIMVQAAKTTKDTGDTTHFYNAGKLLVDQQRQTFEIRAWTQFADASSDELPFERRRREAAERAGVDYYKSVAKYDAWGNKKENTVFGNPVGDYIEKFVYGAKVETKPLHPGDRMIGRWNGQQDDPKKRFKMVELSPTFTKDGKEIRLSTEKFQRYVMLTGKIASRLFGESGLNVDDPKQADMDALKAIFEKARGFARSHVEKETAQGAVLPLDERLIASQASLERRQTLVRGIREGLPAKKPTETLIEFNERRKKWMADKEQKRAELAKWQSR